MTRDDINKIIESNRSLGDGNPIIDSLGVVEEIFAEHEKEIAELQKQMTHFKRVAEQAAHERFKLRELLGIDTMPEPEFIGLQIDKWALDAELSNKQEKLWFTPPECPTCGKLMSPITNGYGDWLCKGHTGKIVFYNHELIELMRKKLAEI